MTASDDSRGRRPLDCAPLPIRAAMSVVPAPASTALPSTEWDVIVLGAGAAGLMAAIAAGQRGRRVLVLDHGQLVDDIAPEELADE